MPRSPLGLILVALALLLVADSSARAWQLPDELPDSPRIKIDDDSIELVPAEQVIESAPPAEDLPQAGRRRSVFSDNASPSAVSPPRQAAPALQPEVEAPTVAVDVADITVAPETAPSIDTTSLKATIFKGIEPGHTPQGELIKLWGEAKQAKPGPNGTIHTFTIEPFPRIDATVNQSRVTALVVYMAQPVPPATVVEQLGLGGIVTVDVLDRSGRKIGEHFPERGVTLVLGQGDDKEKIARILLEPLRAESFLLRVKRDKEHRWQRNLNDLEIAIRLDERDHRAWWLKGEALAEAGDDTAATSAVSRAIGIDGNIPTYQLTLARLLAKSGKFNEAMARTRGVLDNASAGPILQARAALQLGDLLADSPQHKFDEALAMHQRAIELATPLATDQRSEVRRAAKHTLVEAHLAVAEDIARGRWKKKDEIAPQWLARSRAIADELIANEQGDAVVLLDIGCRGLAAMSWLQGKVDPTPAIQQVQADARKFCADCDDALFTRCIWWKQAKALVDAVDVERARNNPEKALAYGAEAEEQLQKLIAAQHRLDESQFQLARLCFLLGSIEAVKRKDHAAAVKWYEKAAERLARPEPDADLAVTARRGEWLVSMGISFWHEGDRAQGLKLTELGANLMESAHREGAVGEESLAVPYHNLAFMYKAQGESEKAQEFAQLAAQIDAAKKTR